MTKIVSLSSLYAYADGHSLAQGLAAPLGKLHMYFSAMDTDLSNVIAYLASGPKAKQREVRWIYKAIRDLGFGIRLEIFKGLIDRVRHPDSRQDFMIAHALMQQANTKRNTLIHAELRRVERRLIPVLNEVIHLAHKGKRVKLHAPRAELYAAAARKAIAALDWASIRYVYATNKLPQPLLDRPFRMPRKASRGRGQRRKVP